MSERPTASMRERVDQALVQERTEQAITSRRQDRAADRELCQEALMAYRSLLHRTLSIPNSEREELMERCNELWARLECGESL